MVDIRDFGGRGDWDLLHASNGTDNTTALNRAIHHILLNRIDYTIIFRPTGHRARKAARKRK